MISLSPSLCGGFNAILKIALCSLFFILFIMTSAVLNVPQSAALGMLSKAQTGDQLLEILNAIVDTQEDQVPVVDNADYAYVESPQIEEVLGVPDDSYVMENDFNDEIDF